MSEDERGPPPFRLAVRQEGRFLHAYFAKWQTMDDAVLLGSLVKQIADDDPELFQMWCDLMRAAVASQLEHQGHGNVEFTGPVAAPEHEKAGNA